MNILICDDRQNETEKLTGLLHKSDFIVETVLFNNGHDALEYIHTGAVVDVCFLDIIMPEMSGVSLAEQLRKNNFTGKIIFLTSSNDYAHESYQVKAFDYLIKPPTPESVYTVLKNLDNELKNKDVNGVLVNISGVSRHIPFCEISHVEVIDHYVYFRLINGEIIEVYTRFNEIAPKLLCDSRFIQCHRSFIVNMYDIIAIAKKEITLKNGIKISISKSYPDTKSVYFKWKFGRNKA